MADTKISDLSADATPTSDDLIITVHDPGGTPANRKVTIASLQAVLSITESQISDFGTYQVQLSEGAFANGDKTKLDGIEASATADQTAAEIAAMSQDWRGQGAETLITATAALEAASSAGVSDGDKGDISVTSSGSVWTIDDEAVTLAKMAHMATGSILGRDTAGTGDVEVISAADARTLLNVEDGATADQTDGEIETAYNTQVSQVSAGERTAGTETAIRRFAPADIASMAGTHGGGSGDSWGDVVDANIVPDGDGTRDLGSDAARFDQGYVDELHVTEGLVISEAADHPITPAAGKAQIWIANTATQTVQVTFDDGTDATVLTDGGIDTLTAATSVGADALVFGDSSDSDNAKKTTITNFVSDNSLVTLTGTQTLTNKTLTTPDMTDPTIAHEYNAQTGTTYELVDADQSAIITMSNASANTLTIPPNAEHAFPIGTKIEIWQLGAGTTTIAGDTGVTLQGNGGSASAGSCDIQTQYGGATLTKIATNTWMVGGDIDAVA